MLLSGCYHSDMIAQNKTNMQSCLICDKLFEPKSSIHKYCSRRCGQKGWLITNLEKKKAVNRAYMTRVREQKKLSNPPPPLPIRDCLVCDKGFVPDIFHPGQKICSKACYFIRYNADNKTKIAQAQKTYAEQNKVKIAAYKILYEDRVRFSGNRIRALRRDKFTCMNCGYEAPGPTNDRTKDVIVHHKDFSGKNAKPNNSMDNLQTLCRPCHIRLHTHRL